MTEMQTHVAAEGERLDQIHYAYYQTLEGFDQLLAANRHLLRKPVLENGDLVYLPILRLPDEVSESKGLWK